MRLFWKRLCNTFCHIYRQVYFLHKQARDVKYPDLAGFSCSDVITDNSILQIKTKKFSYKISFQKRHTGFESRPLRQKNMHTSYEFHDSCFFTLSNLLEKCHENVTSSLLKPFCRFGIHAKRKNAVSGNPSLRSFLVLAFSFLVLYTT
jgi:hypothetical protein